MTPPEHDPFAGAPIARLAPTTDEQREILAAAALGDEANCAYNEAVVVTLRGPVDASRTERALRTVAARHDALRTTFSADLDELCVSDAVDLVLTSPSTTLEDYGGSIDVAISCGGDEAEPEEEEEVEQAF